MFRFENISLNFGDNHVLNDFNLDISEGEHVCFWGPSGSGKTSILKMLVGMILPDSGAIYYNDNLVNEKNICELRKDIAWIPQNINLPAKSGTELAKLINFKPENENIIFEKLSLLGLDDSFLSRDFSEISIGQKQRVIISIALAMKKKILLLDEPTSALDQESVQKMIDSILSDDETTILSASHEQKWGDANDRIVKIN